MPQGLISSGFQADNLVILPGNLIVYGGSFAFTTTGTTVTIKVPDLFRRYHVLGWIYNGTPAAADGPLSVQAPNADGSNSAEGSAGAYFITLTRAAGTTSGLAGTIYIRALP